MTGAKSPVLPFLWYAADYAGAPNEATDCWHTTSDTIFVPVCIFINKQQYRYMFTGMLCTPNTYVFLWLLSDVVDCKYLASFLILYNT